MAANASAQVPTPPTPPTPRAADPVIALLESAVDTVDLIGLQRPYGELPQLPPPICPEDAGPEWTCTIGVQPARCTEHRQRLGGPYEQSAASCVVEVGPVVIECTETLSQSQYNASYERRCRVTRASQQVAGCEDVRHGSYDITDIDRSCTVGPVTYRCEEHHAPWQTPPKSCALQGVPGRTR